jgi:enoyl-CoA hydratase/carnithine racemase
MLKRHSHDRIFTIVLARPEKRNTLNRAMADAARFGYSETQRW